MKNRNHGLDIFRIMCCIGVLDYHVMGAALSGAGGGIAYYGKILYYLAAFCVPGFFLLSGYFLGERDELKMRYVETKVAGIMAKLFGWIIFWTVVHFIRTGEVFDLWENFTQGAVSGGILPIAWFLFTYCFLLILGYPLYHLRKKCTAFFDVAVLLWMGALAAGVGKTGMESRTQALWLHLYIGYFCLGMLLSDGMRMINRTIKRKYLVSATVCVNVICTAVYLLHVTADRFVLSPNSYYGKWYYSLWLVSLFCLLSLIRIEHVTLQRFIVRVSSNTLVVYLASHLPTLYILSRLPLKSAGMAVVMIIVFFWCAQILAEGFRKMPLLRKLV